MSSPPTAGRPAWIYGIWAMTAALLGLAWKTYVQPRHQAKVVAGTSSKSQYKQEIRVALDSFSGYAVLRSDEFRDELKAGGTRLTLSDDGADYTKRLAAIDKGKTDMAVFTVDSLVTASAALGRFPATIVMVIDETHGADAIVVKPGGPRSLTDLNSADSRFVVTPSSPSEFLGRVVRAHFRLDKLGADWMIPRDGAGAVLDEYRKAPAGARRAYVMWEPYVSQAESEGAIRLLDSSKLEGLIVDVLVARRQFLLDEPESVRHFVEGYLRSAAVLSRKSGGMAQLVQDDASKTGSPLDASQAKIMAQGIHWKNTKENYAHFGLLSRNESQGVTHLEDVVANVVHVLVRTEAMAKDPLDGEPTKIFYDQTMGQIQAAGFDPGGLPGVHIGSPQLAGIRRGAALRALSEAEWKTLTPVGDVEVETLSFGRGGARLNVRSERELVRLSRILASWPSYYLEVTGHARSDGDAEANRRLALARAEAAKKHLVGQGVDSQRMRVVAAAPSGAGGAAQSVGFVLRQRR